jgi:hypothetical protein
MSSSGCDREKEADYGEADCLAAGPARLGRTVERGIRAGCPLGTRRLLGRLSCGEWFGRAWWEVAVEGIAGDARLGDDLGDGVLHEAIDTLAGPRTPYWLGDSAVRLHALASILVQTHALLPDAVAQARG